MDSYEDKMIWLTAMGKFCSIKRLREMFSLEPFEPLETPAENGIYEVKETKWSDTSTVDTNTDNFDRAMEILK